MHVVGTDIESGGSDDENSDGDTANDDEVIDLSSSMMDLGIDGSGISQQSLLYILNNLFLLVKRPIQILSPESHPIKKFKDGMSLSSRCHRMADFYLF